MKKIVVLLLTLIVLTACQEIETIKHEHKFIGESEHWEAEYSFKLTEVQRESDGTSITNSKNDHNFFLKYKGTLEELSSVREINYSYETNNGGGSAKEEFTAPPKEVTYKISGGSKGWEEIGEGVVIKVNVKCGNFEETFEL